MSIYLCMHKQAQHVSYFAYYLVLEGMAAWVLKC